MASSKSEAITKVAVIGAGTMGSGIAQVCAQAGYDVTIVDTSQVFLNRALENIQLSLVRLAKKKAYSPESSQVFTSTALAHVKTSIQMSEAVRDADLIIEAIYEDIKVKRELFATLDKLAPDATIFASNTSSLSVREMAVSVNRVDRFLGLHYFNPVPVMPLVEVVKIPETSDQTVRNVTEFVKSLGKTPILCQDTPGFVVNRLLVPMLIEAIRMTERGDATVEDIDEAMKLGAKHPLGPLALVDKIGLDIVKDILDGFRKKEPANTLFAPSPLLERLVNEGKLGVKSGEGFYKYTDGKKQNPNKL